LWRITLEACGASFVEQNLNLKNCDGRKGLDRRLDLCQRISRHLGGFLYGEVVSGDVISCHIVLPEKRVPPASQMNSQAGYF
jgi:hypothetical protein